MDKKLILLIAVYVIVGISFFAVGSMFLSEPKTTYNIYEPNCTLQGLNDTCDRTEAVSVDFADFSDAMELEGDLTDEYLNISCTLIREDAWGCNKYLVMRVTTE